MQRIRIRYSELLAARTLCWDIRAMALRAVNRKHITKEERSEAEKTITMLDEIEEKINGCFLEQVMFIDKQCDPDYPEL